MHYKHAYKIDRWAATVRVLLLCGINNKQTKRTTKKKITKRTKMWLLCFSFIIFIVVERRRIENIQQTNECMRWERKNECNKQWTSILSAVSSLISHLLLCMSRYHCIRFSLSLIFNLFISKKKYPWNI